MFVGYTEPHYCDVDHYSCLMPVAYELDEEDKKYHKVKMVCHCVAEGTCTKDVACEHFLTAPETLEKHLLKELP